MNSEGSDQMNVSKSILQGLQEAVEFEKGNKSKSGRICYGYGR